MWLRHSFCLLGGVLILGVCATAIAQPPRLDNRRNLFAFPNGDYLADTGNGVWGEYNARGRLARQFREVERTPRFVMLFTEFPEPLYVRLWDNGHSEFRFDRPGGAWVPWHQGGGWAAPRRPARPW